MTLCETYSNVQVQYDDETRESLQTQLLRILGKDLPRSIVPIARGGVKSNLCSSLKYLLISDPAREYLIEETHVMHFESVNLLRSMGRVSSLRTHPAQASWDKPCQSFKY